MPQETPSAAVAIRGRRRLFAVATVFLALLLALLAAWGPCENCPEDLDGDDDVDFEDVLLLLAAWGPCP